jgi:hypothetical protein
MNKLFSDALKLSLAAHQVIGLRLMKIAIGGAHGRRESRLMVEEKIKAATDASMEAAKSVAAGEPHLAANRALSVYAKRVDQNLKRLTKG